ncbi:hypothetical protein L7F22_060351 [Adiantum nelumboides]|nr:hypothetical protein [Adiantum nelumboides]
MLFVVSLFCLQSIGLIQVYGVECFHILLLMLVLFSLLFVLPFLSLRPLSRSLCSGSLSCVWGLSIRLVQEINAALGERLSAEDEEAVLAEFEELETKMELERMPEAPKPVHTTEDAEVQKPDSQLEGQELTAELEDTPSRDAISRHLDNSEAEVEEILNLPDAPKTTLKVSDDTEKQETAPKPEPEKELVAA